MEEAIAAYLAPDSTAEDHASAVRRLERTGAPFAQVVAALRAPLTDAAGDARRAAAVALLAELTLEASSASSSPPRPSAAEAHHLARFFAARLSDWPCASPALKGATALLRHDARWRGQGRQGQQQGPLLSLGDAAALARELSAHAQVQAMVAAERRLAYESWAHLIRGWGRGLASAPPPRDDEDEEDNEEDPPPEVDLVDAVIAAMDGERDPNCLLLALDCVLALCQVYSEWGGSDAAGAGGGAPSTATTTTPQPAPLPLPMREHLDAGADELFDVAVNSYFPVVLNAGKKKKKNKQASSDNDKRQQKGGWDQLLLAAGEEDDDAEGDDADDPDARLQRALSRRVVGVMASLPRFAAPSVALIVEKLGSDLPAAKEAAADALPFLLRGRRQAERAAAVATTAAAQDATTTTTYTPPPPPPLPPFTTKSIAQLAEHAVPVWLALKQELLAPAAAAAAADVAAPSGAGGGRAPAALERRAFAARCARSLRDCCSGPVGSHLARAALSDVCVGDLLRYVGADESAVAAAAAGGGGGGGGTGGGEAAAIAASVPTSALDRFAQQRLACVAAVVGAVAAAGPERARDALEAVGRPTVACLAAAAAAAAAAEDKEEEDAAPPSFAPTRASAALCTLSAMLAGGKRDSDDMAPVAQAAAEAARALLRWNSGGGNDAQSSSSSSSKQQRELRTWCCSALRAALVGGAPLLPAPAADQAVRALASVALLASPSAGDDGGDADADLRPLELDLDCWSPASESAPAARAAAYLAAAVAECAALGQTSASASAQVLAAARDSLASALDGAAAAAVAVAAAEDDAQEAQLQGGALALAVLARVAAASTTAAPARFAAACLLPLALPPSASSLPPQPLWPPAAACLVREVLPRLASADGLGPDLEQELCGRLGRALEAAAAASPSLSPLDARAALAVVGAALSRCSADRQAEAARPAVALLVAAGGVSSSAALAAGVVGCASADALRLGLGGGEGKTSSSPPSAAAGALLSALASLATTTTASSADAEATAVARGAAAFALGSLANKWPRLLQQEAGGEAGAAQLRALLRERVVAALDAAVSDACLNPGDAAASARVLAAAQAVAWTKRGLAMRRERLPVVSAANGDGGGNSNSDDDNAWLLGLLRQIDDACSSAGLTTAPYLGACREAVAAIFGLALCADARAAGGAGLALDARSATATERPLWQQRALTAALAALEQKASAGAGEGEGAVLALAQLIRAAPEPALRAAADGVAPRLPAVLRRLSADAASAAAPSPARVALLRGCLDVMAAALMDPAQRPYLEPRAEDALAALVELSRLRRRRRQGEREEEETAAAADPAASLRETALDCLVAAMEGLPYALLHAQRPGVLRAAADALDDDARAVRGAAVRCRRVWAAGA
jgi:hypothetical protein